MAAAGTPTPPKDPAQSGLNFVDPELFLPPGDAAGETLGAAPAKASAPVPGIDSTLEVMLEDPIVDEMLLNAPPPPAPVASAAQLAPAASAAPAPVAPAGPVRPAVASADSAADRAAARIPLAKTAALVAATKLAAAGAASQRLPSKGAAKPAAPAARDGASPQPAAAKEAPSLASWASARAAAATVKPDTGAVVTPAGPARSAPSRAAPATPVTRASAAASAPPAAPAAPTSQGRAVPPSPAMDRDSIARNQVVERYLSGRLPLKAATEFERFCKENPQVLDEIGLPERVNAGLRLLEAAGKPEPWHEAPAPPWHRPQVTLALAGGVLFLVMALVIVAAGSSHKSHRIADLQRQATERALDPATSTREIRLLPSRSGASNTPAITIGGSPSGAQMADLKIDESRSPYRNFRVTIDRIDQGRVGVISNLAKDSNGHLRIALNSSALGPGNYQLTLEGLDWRGAPQPDSWVTIAIQR
jgi:hypothetical protein